MYINVQHTVDNLQHTTDTKKTMYKQQRSFWKDSVCNMRYTIYKIVHAKQEDTEDTIQHTVHNAHTICTLPDAIYHIQYTIYAIHWTTHKIKHMGDNLYIYIYMYNIAHTKYNRQYVTDNIQYTTYKKLHITDNIQYKKNTLEYTASNIKYTLYNLQETTYNRCVYI